MNMAVQMVALLSTHSCKGKKINVPHVCVSAITQQLMVFRNAGKGRELSQVSSGY